MHKKSVPLIRQMGTTDCGIAALTMIFQYYKYKIDISELKATTSIGRNGMSLAKMKEITEEHNFSFKAYGNYETEENLIKCLPIIMCSKENHYVVVAEKKYGKYILLDPLKGKEKVDYSYIKKNFLDVLVCVRPTEKNYKREKRESFLIPINKSKLFLASILTLVTQGIILIPPLIIKKIVNEITYDTLGFNFVKYALLILSVALSYLLANLAKKRVILILQNNIYKDTIFLMLNKIFDIDLSYFESHSSGDIENRFNSVSDIYEFISTALISTDVENVSMMLKKGEKIAFVGSSGSGKTTITKLLLNVFSHYQGQILVNGEDIKQICKEDIDRIFAIVTQVPMAMNGTIRENVDITNTLTDEEIYHYLDLVELKDDIEKFPLGLNTFVGENGQNISGGQKQRIAIARALALKPEVIIFDEATSNLDPLTERRICNNLKQLHITQIVVTHRLNAIQDADTIYVVEKGKIIESGTHVELLQLKGAYYDSVNN